MPEVELSQVSLQRAHLCLEAELVQEVFAKITHAFVTYSQEQKMLLLTPVSSIWFSKIHDASQVFMKDKNRKGDKSLAIRDILLDNDLSMTDRSLEFEVIATTKLIKIKL